MEFTLRVLPSKTARIAGGAARLRALRKEKAGGLFASFWRGWLRFAGR